jgi:hypothetical protein
MIFTLAGLFAVIVVCVTLVTLGSLRFASKYLSEMGDDERCPEIRRWHPVDQDGKVDQRRISTVTRCTLRVDHYGPHHTPHPATEKPYWWESEVTGSDRRASGVDPHRPVVPDHLSGGG